MKKRIKAGAFLIAIACLMTVLSACHGKIDRASFTLPDALDESRPIEITFWAKNDSNEAQKNIYKQAIEAFESYYPSVTVHLKSYSDYGDIYNDVITNIATDTMPNVCITYPDHIATYLTGENVVVPLDDLMSDAKFGFGGSDVRFDSPDQTELIPKFLSECRINGTTYALPFMRSTEVCYVNKTYVEALGFTLPETLTWDFVWEVSAAATAKNSDGTYVVNGQKVMIPFLYKSTDNMMIQMLKQKNAGYSKVSGEIEIWNDTTKEILTDIADAVSVGAFSTFKISSYPANFLNAGQCIFAIDSTAGSTWMGPDAPLIDISEEALVDFETVVMEIPQYDTENPQMISQGPSVCVFNNEDPQVVLASWLFAQFLLTDDVQISYAKTEGYVPVTSKAQQNPVYTDYLAREGENGTEYYSVKLQATKLLLDHTDDTFVTPVFNGSASLRNAAGQLIENVTKAVRRKKTVDDAYLEQLYTDVSALYRLDQVAVDSDVRLEFDALPKASVALLCGIALAWIGIGIYVLTERIRHGRSK